MTSPRLSYVRCAHCDHQFEDWWRPSIDPVRDRIDPDYVDQSTAAECPRCGHRLYAEALEPDAPVPPQLELMDEPDQ